MTVLTLAFCSLRLAHASQTDLGAKQAREKEG